MLRKKEEFVPGGIRDITPHLIHRSKGLTVPTEGGIFDPTVFIFEVFPGFLNFFQVFPGFFNREIDFSIKESILSFILTQKSTDGRLRVIQKTPSQTRGIQVSKRHLKGRLS